MELAQEIISGLEICANPEHISDKDYKTILQTLSNDGSSDSPKLDLNHKRAVLATCSFITECSKRDTTIQEIRDILDDCHFDESRISAFLEAYTACKQLYRSSLSRCSSLGRAQIVDVDWRLDYTIKSNQSDKQDQLSYLISLQVLEPETNEIRNVTMRCSLVQLQDLVGKLKDAIRCIEKHVS